MGRFVATILLLFSSACATPYLDREQLRTRAAAVKVLKKQSAAIEQQIAASGSSGALVVMNAQLALVGVSPDLDPIAAAQRMEWPAEAARCYFVYEHRQALNPQEFSCSQLQAESGRLLALRQEQTQLADKAKAAETRIGQLAATVDRFGKDVAEFDQALTTSFKLGVINADTIDAHSRSLREIGDYVKESRAELTDLDASVDKLVADYDANSKRIEEAIAKLPK